MLVTPGIWVGRGLGGVVWGPGRLAVKCRYLYGPVEGGKSCQVRVRWQGCAARGWVRGKRGGVCADVGREAVGMGWVGS